MMTGLLTDIISKNLHKICSFIFVLTTLQIVPAQIVPDSAIIQAMQDELKRNIRELEDTSLAKPFFISYTIADAEQIQVSGTLGAIVNSDKNRYKDWSARLLVGSYEITDENFYSSQPDEPVYQPNIEMPVENDYIGIRRSLWLTTNNLYYSAARTYHDKITQIELKKLDKSSLDVPDFSKVPVVKKYISSRSTTIQKEELETKVRNLSSFFRNYPDISRSYIILNVFTSYVYFTNTEGTDIRFPFNITSLNVQLETYTSDGERLNRNITYTFNLPDELPSDSKLLADMEMITENLLSVRESVRFDDTYYGPVLLLGEVAAETMEKFLFAGSDALISSRQTLHSSHQMNMSFEEPTNDLQSRIGKSIISKDLTITAEPFLKEFNGRKLIGSFEVDAEGVIPPEKLILVENGSLKTLLNGRTPSKQVPESNGHMRLEYNNRGLTNTIGPGVIRIVTSNPVPIEELKKQLLNSAREEGLDYAIMIKSLDIDGSDVPFNYYKLDLKTGEETLLRAVRLKNLTMQSFHRSAVFSDSIFVHNTVLEQDKVGSNALSGIPSSFILPYGVLLNDIQLESTRKPLNSLLPVINNPVGKEESKTENPF